MAKIGNKNAVGNNGGRPTDYRARYPRRLYQILKAGGFRSTFCKAARISENTFTRWCEVHPEFSESYEVGRAAAKARFMKEITKISLEPSGNVNNTMLSMLAANVHGLYSANTKTSNDNNTKVSGSIVVTRTIVDPKKKE